MQNSKTLFNPVCDQSKCNPRFERLRTSPGSEPTRRMLDDVFQTFVDPDGNFLQQFQTTGFDSRFFELYLHAYFSRSGFIVDRSHPNPDFLVTRSGVTVAIEATTVNASQGGVLATSGTKIKELSEEERGEYSLNELPIRFGSALFSKLKSRYWGLPHCADLPFVIAVEAFHEEGSLEFSYSGLAGFLYGLRQSARWDEDGNLVIETEPVRRHQIASKTVPSAFFSQSETEHVSAVLFTNSGTSAKFTRMGYQTGYGCDVVNVRRFGRAYNPDPQAMDSTLFAYDLDDPPFVESWGQGLVVLHNPNALRPIPDTFFESAIQGHYEDGRYVPLYSEWHAFRSETVISYLGEGKKGIPRGLVGYGPQGVAAIPKEVFRDLCHSTILQPRSLEDGWFADQSEAFLGLVTKDTNQGLWGFVVFARDEHFRFRPIHSESGHRLRLIACEAVQVQIMGLLLKPQRIFPK
jgi:hypothetical protein